MPGPWTYRLEIADPDQTSQVKIPFKILFRPPAPAFYATVEYRGNLTTVPALIDTGASFTVIPHKVAVLLSLRKYSERIVTVANGQEETRPIFKANLSFLDFSFSDHLLVSLEGRRHMLIGRDILNSYKATFDGPSLQFSLE